MTTIYGEIDYKAIKNTLQIPKCKKSKFEEVY